MCVITLISTEFLLIFLKVSCSHTHNVSYLFSEVVELLASCGAEAFVIHLDHLEEVEMHLIQDVLWELTDQRTVPRVFSHGKCIGGCDDCRDLHAEGKLEAMLMAQSTELTASSTEG